MPTIKRWFHCSQELNRDPEFRVFVKRFGLAGMRFWIEVLAILDRTDNYWNLHTSFDLGILASACESKKAHMLACYEHLTNMKWLRVGVDVENKLFIYAPKWSEYNKRREHDGSMKDTCREHPGIYPTPTPTPTPKKKEKTLKKESKRKKAQGDQPSSKLLTKWPDGFTLTEDMAQYALERGIRNPQEVFEDFRIKAGARNYRYADWKLAWYAWVRNPLQQKMNGHPSDPKTERLKAQYSRLEATLEDDPV